MIVVSGNNDCGNPRAPEFPKEIENYALGFWRRYR